MQFKFIAVNGDNVGDSIGSAIASDNHEELDRITGGLKNAHGEIDKWVESIGGKIVTSSGDEGIYKIPSESFDESTLENLRSRYSQSTGTTITVGVGDSMSEASKALIYGKLNDKDQVVDYDPHIDDYIAGHDDEVTEDGEESDIEDKERLPSSDELDEEVSQGASTEMGMGGDSEEEDPSIVMDADDAVDEHEDLVDTLRSPSHEDDLEEADEQEGELEEYQDIADEDETLAEEGEMSEDDLDVQPEDQLKEVVGQDIDGDGDIDSIKASDETLTEEGESVGYDVDDDGDMESEDQASGMDMEEEDGNNQSAISDMIHANMSGEEEMEEEGDSEGLRQDIVSSLMTFKENKMMLEQAKAQNPKLYEATILMLRSMIEMAKKLNMNPEADMAGQEAQAALPDAEMDDMSAPEGIEEEGDDEEVDEAQMNMEEESESLPAAKPKPFGKSEVARLYSDLIKGMEILSKARVDSDKSFIEKIRARRERKEKDKGIKGVHSEHHDKGVSQAGHEVRFAKKPNHGMSGIADNKTIARQGKDKHRQKIQEIKGMKKPNLPKSEKDIVKTEKKYWRDELKERERKAKEARKPKKVKGKKPIDHALEEIERKMKVDKEVTSRKK